MDNETINAFFEGIGTKTKVEDFEKLKNTIHLLFKLADKIRENNKIEINLNSVNHINLKIFMRLVQNKFKSLNINGRKGRKNKAEIENLENLFISISQKVTSGITIINTSIEFKFLEKLMRCLDQKVELKIVSCLINVGENDIKKYEIPKELPEETDKFWIQKWKVFWGGRGNLNTQKIDEIKSYESLKEFIHKYSNSFLTTEPDIEAASPDLPIDSIKSIPRKIWEAVSRWFRG